MLLEVGAQGRNRTTDTRIFSPLLYRLSYLGILILSCLIAHATLKIAIGFDLLVLALS
jgi:hypothetical protein